MIAQIHLAFESFKETLQRRLTSTMNKLKIQLADKKTEMVLIRVIKVFVIIKFHVQLKKDVFFSPVLVKVSSIISSHYYFFPHTFDLE